MPKFDNNRSLKLPETSNSLPSSTLNKLHLHRKQDAAVSYPFSPKCIRSYQLPQVTVKMRSTYLIKFIGTIRIFHDVDCSKIKIPHASGYCYVKKKSMAPAPKGGAPLPLWAAHQKRSRLNEAMIERQKGGPREKSNLFVANLCHATMLRCLFRKFTWLKEFLFFIVRSIEVFEGTLCLNMFYQTKGCSKELWAPS